MDSGGSLERHTSAQSSWESYKSPHDGSVRFRRSHVGVGRGGGERSRGHLIRLVVLQSLIIQARSTSSPILVTVDDKGGLVARASLWDEHGFQTQSTPTRVHSISPSSSTSDDLNDSKESSGKDNDTSDGSRGEAVGERFHGRCGRGGLGSGRRGDGRANEDDGRPRDTVARRVGAELVDSWTTSRQY